MEIGSIPRKEDKIFIIHKNLFLLEYTSYSQVQRHHLFLENSSKIVPSVFDLNACNTTVFHSATEFKLISNPKEKINDTDGYLVTYLMYNDVGYYFAHKSNIKDAWEEAKLIVHPNIEKIILNRYQLINYWKNKPQFQTFKIELNNFKNLATK